jgi:DNA-binding MarR family transcriptional regulator
VARRDRPSQAALDAWQGLLRTHLVLVERLDRDLIEQHGIALAWYDVLVQLHASGGETTMGELAERLLISPSTCTRVVEKMATAALVERRIDEVDHRVRHARLTPDGRTLLRAAAKTHLAGIQRHFGAHLDDGEAAMLAERFVVMRRSATS